MRQTTIDLEGYKGGETKPQGASEASDSLHSTAVARIVDLLCEGPIRGFRHGSTNPLKDIYLNETPVANDDGTLNFSNIQIDSRSGTQTQSYMPAFTGSVENEFDAPVELKAVTPWTQALSNPDLSAVRVRLSVPSLQKTNTSTGDITGFSIKYIIELSTDGGAFQTVVTSGFTGKTTSKYERTHRINLPTATTGWTIRVTRQTPNQNLAYISDTTTVEGYTEIIDAKLRYPNSALVGILIDAEQFSNIPSRAYDVYGRLVLVPSNYDPDTRVYTGVWDGSFKQAWTDNPAWIFYDVATNKRFSVGRYVSAALVNKWVLYDIARYCDELVPDGQGGMEPRFTCTLYLQTQGDAYKVLGDLATVFRGQMYWAAGAIQASADMPTTSVYPYTAANVINGEFSYSGSRRKTRYTVAMVTWNDPNDFGRQKVATVVDKEGLARYGYQPTTQLAVGCRSLGQAQRAGLWTLYTSRVATETCSWKVGLAGTLAAPGQVVTVYDPARAGKRNSGRIMHAEAITAANTPLIAMAGDTVLPLRDASARVVSSAVVTHLRREDWRGNTELTTASRTNLLPYSTDLTHWAASNGVASAGVTAPDGVGVMRRITANAGVTNAQLTETVTVTNGATYTLSAYVRRDQNRYVKLFGFGNGSGGAVIDLQTGTTQVNSTWLSVGVEMVSATVARIYGVVQPISSGQTNVGLAGNMAGTAGFVGTEFLDVWGVQLEPGSARTPLIVTGAAAVTLADYHLNANATVTLGAAAVAGDAFTWDGTGALGGCTTTSIYTDAPPGLVAIGDQLTVTLSNGVSEVRTISAIDGNHLTVGTPFSEVPQSELMWAVDSSLLEGATYRVISVREPSSSSKTLEWEIIGLQHNESLFAAVDIGARIETPVTSVIPPSAQPAPSTVLLSAFSVKGAVRTTLGLTIQWTPAAGATRYVAQYRRDSGSWQNIGGPVNGLSVDVDGIKPGSYEARVWAINASNKQSVPVSATPLTVSDPTDVPTTVEAIQIQVSNADADATNALQQLAYISDDNTLTQGEKSIPIRDYSIILAEQAGIDAEADRYTITTEKTAYDSAITALTAYLATLTAPTLWNNLAGDTSVVGSTWRSKWQVVYTARQTLLNKILASAKAKGDYAVNLGLTAPVINPAFSNGLDNWTFDSSGAGEWVVGSGANSPDAHQSTFLQRTGQATPFTTRARNTGGIPVKVGQTVTAMAAMRSISANTTASAYVIIAWYNAAGTEISNSSNGVTICRPLDDATHFTQGVSRVYGTAPAGAVRASIHIEFDNHTSGVYTVTSAWLGAGHASADEIPESDIRKWAAESGADVTSGKSIDVLVDGTDYARTKSLALINGVPVPVASGKNMAGNPSFILNTMGTDTGTTFSGSGKHLCDGWDTYFMQSGNIIAWEAGNAYNVGPHPYLSARSNVIASNGTAVNWIRSTTNFPAVAGQTFVVTLIANNAWNTTPANVDRILRIGVKWLKSDGSAATPAESAFDLTVTSGQQTLTGVAPAPADAAYGFLYCGNYLYNHSGAVYTMTGLPLDTRLLYAACVSQQNLATEVAGTLSTQRNLPLVTWGNYGGMWNGLSLTYNTTTTSCTFSASAASFTGGGDSIAYNASSATVSGAAGSTVTYYLYYDDPSMTGGAKTMQITTSQITSLNANGRVLLGSAKVTYPSSGTGSGGGGSACPDENAWVLCADPTGERTDWCVQAKQVKVGDYLRLTDGRAGRVTYSQRTASPRVRVEDAYGRSLTCSPSAPLELPGTSGDCVRARRSQDVVVRVLCSQPVMATKIRNVEPLADGFVQHITCENACFWTGDDPSFLYAHHNLKPLGAP